jgi:guanylate kinase
MKAMYCHNVLVFFNHISLCAANFIFFVGPSGVGKSTLIEKIVEQSNGKIVKAVSHTTRAPRLNEVDGKDYHFVSLEQFQAMEESNQFIISGSDFNHHYGLSYQELDEKKSKNRIVIKDIGGQSIETIKECLGDDCKVLFIAPPSHDTLWNRLNCRSLNTGESSHELETRLNDALRVLRFEPQCDFTIIANDLDETVKKLTSMIHCLHLSDHEGASEKNQKQIPEKKILKYNTPTVIRYRFTKEGLRNLKALYHKIPINSIIMDLYNFEEKSIDVNIQKRFPHLICWDDAKRYFIEPTPVYGTIEQLKDDNLPFLKFSEDGVHLEVWLTHPLLLNNSLFENYWFGSNIPQEKKGATFEQVETEDNPYLVSLLDLEAKHLPLLRSMKEKIDQNLKLYHIGKNDRIDLFFHFPYAPKTASLHLHVRVNQHIHPLEAAKSISLDDVIVGFERGLTIDEIILERQNHFCGFIYSDHATLDLPRLVSEIFVEEVDNPFLIN